LNQLLYISIQLIEEHIYIIYKCDIFINFLKFVYMNHSQNLYARFAKVMTIYIYHFFVVILIEMKYENSCSKLNILLYSLHFFMH